MLAPIRRSLLPGAGKFPNLEGIVCIVTRSPRQLDCNLGTLRSMLAFLFSYSSILPAQYALTYALLATSFTNNCLFFVQQYVVLDYCGPHKLTSGFITTSRFDIGISFRCSVYFDCAWRIADVN